MKMTALKDRPENPYVGSETRVYKGDTVEIWKDEDISNLYFVQTRLANRELTENKWRATFEMEAEQIIDIFGSLPEKPVNICQCDRCSAVFNGLIGAFVCPECYCDDVTTDLSIRDVFTPWAGASNAANDEAAEEMYKALQDGKVFS